LIFILIAVQSFRAVSGMIRNNATDVIICKQQNQKELMKIAEEYGDLVGGYDNFMKLYDEAHKDRLFIFIFKIIIIIKMIYMEHPLSLKLIEI
jgi:hypothetical protein